MLQELAKLFLKSPSNCFVIELYHMKNHLRKLTYLAIPFILMIIINEGVRPTIKEKPYSKHGLTTMNPLSMDKEKCSWICHNHTQYCKDHHVKYLKPFYGITDIVYFGIINLLHSTGNYGLANIVFLVIGIPFLIWWFVIKSISIQKKNKNFKR